MRANSLRHSQSNRLHSMIVSAPAALPEAILNAGEKHSTHKRIKISW